MKDKKTFELKTNAFELKIHWNGPLVFTQIAVLLGVAILLISSDSQSIQNMCKIILLLDLISIIVSLISVKTDTSNDSVEKEETISKEELDTDTSDKKKASTSPVKNVEGTIKNKVPSPGKKENSFESKSTKIDIDIKNTTNLVDDLEDWSS